DGDVFDIHPRHGGEGSPNGGHTMAARHAVDLHGDAFHGDAPEERRYPTGVLSEASIPPGPMSSPGPHAAGFRRASRNAMSRPSSVPPDTPPIARLTQRSAMFSSTRARDNGPASIGSNPSSAAN